MKHTFSLVIFINLLLILFNNNILALTYQHIKDERDTIQLQIDLKEANDTYFKTAYDEISSMLERA